MKSRILQLRSVQVFTVWLIAIGLIVGLMWSLAQVAGAQGPQLLGNVGCPPGNAYDSACDVTHDGEINVLDVERVAGRWRTTGTYVETCWSLTGNAATNPITNFLGTTDNVTMTLAVSNTVALRMIPTTGTPNLIGGYNGNSAANGAMGATISGGGTADFEGTAGPNRATDDYGTVGGGANNQAGGGDAVDTTDRPFNTVGGGWGNTASGYGATVGGGIDNTASGFRHATVGGGVSNTASGDWSTVSGGESNTASNNETTVSGGFNNGASGLVATVGGGQDNTASGDWATISGGDRNTASGADTAIGGGFGNEASGRGATVGGGFENIASGANSATVGGGSNNTASGEWATVGGGERNEASGDDATVSGGFENIASREKSTIGGGWNNQAIGDDSVIAGGTNNKALGFEATIGGGDYNTAGGSGRAATVGGGAANNASGAGSTVSGGADNIASGEDATIGGGFENTASGQGATVPGGESNTAAGDSSFAAGRRAKANGNGSFVWGDSTDADIVADGADVFLARANGGFWFGAVVTNTTISRTADLVDAGVFISTTTGAKLTTGGAWTNASDRKLKENFATVDDEGVLTSLAGIPIYTWNYKAEAPSVRHLGPTAQDFYAAFGLGADDKHISTVDAGGVALAAIQGLYRVTQEKDAQIAVLETQIEAQDKRIASQQKQIDELMGRLAAVEANATQIDTTPAGLPVASWPLLGLVFAGMGLVWVNRRRDS